MAKANRVYMGNDSYGRAIEVAQSANGKWFARHFGWNGFSNVWSKWQEHDTPTHPARVKNMVEYADAPEYVDIPEEHRQNRIEWGFNTLRIVPGPHRYRLPE